MIAFWQRIVCSRQDKIAAVLYKLLYNMHIQHFFHSKWVCCIEKLLNDCGLSEYWLTQNVPKNVILSKIVKQRLCDQFKQSWSESVFTSAKCLNYRIFKWLHQFESYLVQLPYDLRKAYCNYRCLNHRLPIEKGRLWGVKRDDRICNLCDLEHIGDEFHYLFECKYFEREKKQLLPNIQKPNVLIYHDLFNDNDINNCIKIAKFCKIILIAIN